VTSRVYFVQADSGDGLIKIGTTSSRVEDRLRTMQTGSPVRLKVLGTVPGDSRVESQLHLMFSDIRMHGEWFRPEARLLEYISLHSEPYNEALDVTHAVDVRANWPGKNVSCLLLSRVGVKSKTNPIVSVGMCNAMWVTRSEYDSYDNSDWLKLVRRSSDTTDRPAAVIMAYVVDRSDSDRWPPLSFFIRCVCHELRRSLKPSDFARCVKPVDEGCKLIDRAGPASVAHGATASVLPPLKHMGKMYREFVDSERDVLTLAAAAWNELLTEWILAIPYAAAEFSK
jgi:hypothetical protein